jgi:glycosyltransferase involved in cell wall biosynthesis
VPEKISIVSGIFPPDPGGPAKFASEFSDWLLSKNVAIQVITYADDKTYDLSKSKLVISLVSRNQSLPRRFSKLVMKIGRQAKGKPMLLAVGAFIEVYIASILFNFPYVAKVPGDIVWERARNSKITRLGIEEFQKEKLNFKYRLFRHLYTRSLKRAQTVVVPSVGLYVLCLDWGIPKSNLKLIYNSVHFDEVVNKTPSPPIFDLITVCRLVPWKGVDELIKYAASSDRTLLVVGDGPERFHLETLALSLKAKVTFVGDVSHEKVLKYLQDSQLFVLNSYYEGLPHALVEARALGVLTVARAGTGSAEVINDDLDGYLIRSDRSLEATIETALRMQSSSQDMILKARADCHSRFNRATNFPAILNLLKGLV